MRQKLTPWFDGRKYKPVRPGVYQQKNYYGTLGYQYWDGSRWGFWCATAAQAYDQRGKFVPAIYHNDNWRGLMNQHDGGAA